MELLQTGINNAVVPKKKKGLLSIILKYKFLYLLLIPGLLSYIIFSYAPMYGIQLAFKTHMWNKGIMGSPLAPNYGMDNFMYIFKNPDFLNALRNTFIISLGKILLSFPVPILLSILLNELRSDKFKKIVQSILYMPHFLSWIIVYGIIYGLFSVTIGVSGKLLQEHAPRVLSNPDAFKALIFISQIWKSAGWGTIIYLAAIAGIDPTYYEAAIIDGASRFKQVIYVTLPLLRFAIFIMLILTLGSVMNAGFDQVYSFIDPGTTKVGEILDTLIFKIGIKGGSYARSTAMSLFTSVLNLCFLYGANKAAKLMGEDGLY